MKREEILRKLAQTRAFFSRFGVCQLRIFGSCDSGEQTETSYMDVLVEPRGGTISFFCETDHVISSATVTVVILAHAAMVRLNNSAPRNRRLKRSTNSPT